MEKTPRRVQTLTRQSCRYPHLFGSAYLYPPMLFLSSVILRCRVTILSASAYTRYGSKHQDEGRSLSTNQPEDLLEERDGRILACPHPRGTRARETQARQALSCESRVSHETTYAKVEKEHVATHLLVSTSNITLPHPLHSTPIHLKKSNPPSQAKGAKI